MGLLDMCCPKKPKKSLDYIIKWVENTDKIIKDLSDTVQELNKWKEDISKETLGPIFNEYAKTYPWDNVPAFNTKADKVKNVVVGHLASLDENGNLQDSGKKPADFIPNVSGATEGNLPQFNAAGNIQDSGKKPADFIPNVSGATEGNLPQFDAAGNIQDSGKKPADFALVGHSHSAILDTSTESRISIQEGGINIFIQGEGSGGETDIDANNIGNLHRALVTPSSIPENDATKLITSKAVYDAITTKAPYYGSTISIESDGNGNLPISNGGDVERYLNNFVSNTEVGKLYNIIVYFYKPTTYGKSGNSYSGIAYWNIEGQGDDTIVRIYVGDYIFQATKGYGTTMWESGAFDKFKISTFLENF